MPMSATELAGALAAELDPSSSAEDLPKAVAQLMARFVDLGLIERSGDRHDDPRPTATA
jgi:hypothetical protein